MEPLRRRLSCDHQQSGVSGIVLNLVKSLQLQRYISENVTELRTSVPTNEGHSVRFEVIALALEEVNEESAAGIHEAGDVTDRPFERRKEALESEREDHDD